LRAYKEDIDKKIIEILYKEEKELTFGELEDKLKPKLKEFSYKSYASRLNSLSKSLTSQKIEDNRKQSSRYIIQPVLNRREENKRGGKVFYSLTRDARSICDLKLPILKSESKIEKAYFLLLRYFAFTEPISQSQQNSNTLPGISASEISSKQKTESELPLGYNSYSREEINECFNLLEEKNLIKKVLSLQLINLNQERYILVDDSLRYVLRYCWNMQAMVRQYLNSIWTYIRKPTDDERIWLEYMKGKQKTQRLMSHYNRIRKEYNNKRDQGEIEQAKQFTITTSNEMKNKYNSLKEKYPKTLNSYSFLVKPLLNQIYPEFLRNNE